MTATEVDASSPSQKLKIAVGVATMGRPDIVTQMVRLLGKQSRRPDVVVVCAPTMADADGVEAAFCGTRVVTGGRGLPQQRNAILRAAHDCDVVVFFDDDFFPAKEYIRAVEDAFVGNPDVVMVTGTVVADGICGPGLTVDHALAVLSEVDATPAPDVRLDAVYNGYGCNMSIRLSLVTPNGVWFDEALPMYAWLEDVDFSRRVAAYGRIVKLSGANGVHLGIKKGRQSGVRLGYSQVANPLYLVAKGSCSRLKAAKLISRNIIANALKSLRPEPYVDRAGRLLGNARALCDLAIGRAHPQKILNL